MGYGGSKGRRVAGGGCGGVGRAVVGCIRGEDPDMRR